LGEKWRSHFGILSYLDNENLHHRQFHGITHHFSHAVSGLPAFSVIVLSDLIAYLPNQDQERRTPWQRIWRRKSLNAAKSRHTVNGHRSQNELLSERVDVTEHIVRSISSCQRTFSASLLIPLAGLLNGDIVNEEALPSKTRIEVRAMILELQAGLKYHS